MPLIQIRHLSLGFGGPLLLDGVDLRIHAGERVCLVGRNGSGKSTLMRLIAGRLQAEDGEIQRRQGLRVAMLDQEVPAFERATVFEVAAEGLGETGELLQRYHRLSQQLAAGGDSTLAAGLEDIQHRLEARQGWGAHRRVDSVLSHLQLAPDSRFDALSGGLKRRALLARALVAEPELLLLDEPTNHLDIDAIEWLESFLLGFRGTLLFVSHDRRFLQRLATRIVDLDRGRLSDWPGDYPTYLKRKQARLEDEARQQAAFDKKLAQEEAWIRQGIQARRSRNQGRVRALLRLREQRRLRRGRGGGARLRTLEHDISGKRVIETERLGFAYGERPVVRELDVTILRGDKVGIIGPNGVGKSTLLNLLLGRLKPDRGHVHHGTRLEIAYFDQLRAQLDDDKSVLDNLAEGRQQISVDGRQRHVISYLQDFLFSPERTLTPVSALSGGERNRLLLAKLFSKPANLLVLDEPTNDLDVDTLELLEERLVAYRGTLLLVSHDRSFLDNVVTSTLVFEGDGHIGEYVGGYDDWLRQRAAVRTAAPAPRPRPARAAAAVVKRKLGYQEQRELQSLPNRIEALEQQQADLHASLADPGFYRQDGATIAATKDQLAQVEQALESAYRRWETLESQCE